MKNLILSISFSLLVTSLFSQAPGGVSSDLKIWLKADAGTSGTTDGDLLTYWNDQSGNAVNATQSGGSSTQPRFITNAMNGNPALEFNGGARFFNIDYSSLGTTYTIITVVKRADNGTLRYVVGVQSLSPRGMHIGYSTNTNLRMSEGAATANADVTVSGYDVNTEVPVILMGENAGASSRTVTEIENGATLTATNATSASGPGMTAGVIGRGFTTSGFSGNIAEIIAYNRALTSAEKASIYTYLSVKYGLTVAVTEHDYFDDATYGYDIFGIGKNTATQGLNQTSSSSENADGMITFSSPSSLDNGDYLVCGNNNGALTFSAYGGSNCAISTMLDRAWKAEETGETGSITITIDITSLTGVNPEDLVLMVDLDGDGYNDENPIEGTYTAPNMVFTGVNLPDNAIFTLAEGVATWYAVGTGTTTDAIWAKTPSGTAQTIPSLCSKVSMNIQAGYTVTNNVALVARNFTIATGATFIQNATNLTLHGTYLNTGTHTITTGNVNFNGTVSQTIGGTTITEFNNINCNNAAGVSVSGTGARVKGVLQVNSGVFSTNGKLTLSSYSTTTGSIGPLSTGSVAGNVTIERYHNALAAGWLNISSPAQGKTVSDWNDDLITTGFAGSDYPSYPFNNIQRYNESAAGNRNQGYVGATSIAEALVGGTGYFTYMNAGAVTIDVDGSIYSGAQSLPVSYTNNGDATADGWNLVGNPYPSAIDWDASGWTKTNMTNAVYIWDAATAQYSSYVAGVGTNGGTGIIPSTQSFFVMASGSSPALAITETVKTSSSGTFKTMRTDGVLSLNMKIGNYSDETVLVWNNEALSSYEKERDAFKMESQVDAAPYMATVSTDGQDLSINNLFTTNDELIVPVKMKSSEGGVCSLKWNGLTVDNYTIYFEDKSTGKSYDLSKETEVKLNIATRGDDARFQIRIKKNSAEVVQEQTIDQHITGTMTDQGIQLTFNFEKEESLRIVAYNALGQQLIEPIVGKYSNQVIHFSDRRYGMNAIIEVLNTNTGERTVIRLAN
ncbi:MAG: hypothetical protein RL204_2083 [Bacteroidota bacterium]|jgi:hypothetical protein